MIINPISGNGRYHDLEEKVRDYLGRHDIEVDVRHSERAGHCSELAAEGVRAGYDAVLAAGGDGTVNEVASALRDTGMTMGIIPRGSGNGLARHLDESADIDKALRVIAADYPRDCDYGTVNGRPFFCTCGVGYDAAVAHDFASMSSRGLSTYLRACARVFFKYKPQEYDITADGVTRHVKAFILAFCNASQYGNNAYISPCASICDGELDMMIVRSGNMLTRCSVGIDLMAGRLDRNHLVEHVALKTATVRQQPGPGHLDGEPVDMPEVMEIAVHPGKLRLFADPGKREFKPMRTPLRSLRADIAYKIRTRRARKTDNKNRS